MTHDDHQAQPGYDERQILVDGCRKCEERSMDCLNTLGWMDGQTFARAWRRAYEWQYRDKPEELGPLSEYEMPVLHMLWALQIMLERCCRVPLGQLPSYIHPGEQQLYGDILSEAARLSVIVSKAEGVVRTSNYRTADGIDDLRVVPQWWESMVEALAFCPDGACGPLIDATDEEYDPDVLGDNVPDLPPYQFGYCEKCHRGYRWDVDKQRLTPLEGLKEQYLRKESK